MAFKVKQNKVTWKSQSHATWKRKAGVVAAVIPAGTRPTKESINASEPGHTINFHPDMCGGRDHESYLVSVPPQKEKKRSPTQSSIHRDVSALSAA